MKITLRIENFDSLPDGGPLEFTVTGRGFEAGRGSEMDWTLPDPNRRISSRHFEVALRDRQFWLNDLSANGTFLYGQNLRISSPHLLSHNDRLQVGHYIIRVMIDIPAPAPSPFAAMPAMHVGHAGGASGSPFDAAPPPPAPAGDPWSMLPTPAPMPTPMPAPNRAPMPLAGQFGDSFLQPPAPPVTAPPGGMGGAAAAQPAPPPMPAAEPFALRQPVVATPLPPQAPATTATADGAALLDAICRGAGLPEGSLAAADSVMLGEEIGKCLRIATQELMALLGARAAAKQFVKSSSRTMIGGLNNSPLKFKPTPAEAMQTMFVQKSESYLNSTASFQQGFDDIKRHQTAVYAAMQPALARLLEDLSPESIEERASGGLMSSKKASAWDLFVARWDAKTHPYENGMLDVFLAYFSDAYDDAVKKTGG
ncbi:type VI secretion system-associated FHA domain protein TagH [Fuscibacter oryzae]|uniref:Type VI secretion system-associated FHA domain protein TagH n=1 Tax=Fuscibacter oryzae TaxID=2803939 RepID=A0A8J7SWD9_9RHOB|nr:type VI secretion system-associated FHA domain protein TagH [Fuscibacter oryzae]MBL4929581.1 type VI secretion system-associated FHA domain protein TagH [Fuscibacter oryzae]